MTIRRLNKTDHRTWQKFLYANSQVQFCAHLTSQHFQLQVAEHSPLLCGDFHPSLYCPTEDSVWPEQPFHLWTSWVLSVSFASHFNYIWKKKQWVGLMEVESILNQSENSASARFSKAPKIVLSSSARTIRYLHRVFFHPTQIYSPRKCPSREPSACFVRTRTEKNTRF